MASRISRRCDGGEDVRWLWERGGGVPSSSIQHRKARSGMLFSCSVSYRASTSEHLFRQFHDAVLGSSASQRGTLQGKEGYVVLLLPGFPHEGVELLHKECL